MLSLWAYNYDWGGTPPEPVIESRGGISPEDARRYREYLEKLTAVTSQKEITQEVIEAAQVIEELPMVIPEIKAIIKQSPQIDIQALSLELFNIQEYLDRMLAFTYEIQRQKRQKDDELALLLLIN